MSQSEGPRPVRLVIYGDFNCPYSVLASRACRNARATR